MIWLCRTVKLRVTMTWYLPNINLSGTLACVSTLIHFYSFTSPRVHGTLSGHSLTHRHYPASTGHPTTNRDAHEPPCREKRTCRNKMDRLNFFGFFTNVAIKWTLNSHSLTHSDARCQHRWTSRYQPRCSRAAMSREKDMSQ